MNFRMYGFVVHFVTLTQFRLTFHRLVIKYLPRNIWAADIIPVRSRKRLFLPANPESFSHLALAFRGSCQVDALLFGGMSWLVGVNKLNIRAVWNFLESGKPIYSVVWLLDYDQQNHKHIDFVLGVFDRSQTYSANEINLILAIDGETNKPIEWVDIDPEAFTGNMNISTYKAAAL